MNLDKVIKTFDDQMIENIVPFYELMQQISVRMVNVFAYEYFLNDKEVLRLSQIGDDDGSITIEMYIATTNMNGTEKRSILSEKNLGLLLHYAPQAYKFAKEIHDSISSA